MQKKQAYKSFCGKVCSIGRSGIGIIVFQVRDRDKGPYLFIEKAIGENIGENILLDKSFFFVRE